MMDNMIVLTTEFVLHVISGVTPGTHAFGMIQCQVGKHHARTHQNHKQTEIKEHAYPPHLNESVAEGCSMPEACGVDLECTP